MRDFPKSKVLDCSHCGNTTPHRLSFEHSQDLLYDEFDDDTKIYETYTWLCYTCGTCGAINLYGAFFGTDCDVNNLQETKLHPRGSGILPPSHTMEPNQPIPDNVLRLYCEVWPLRHRAPSAFVGQVRRLLEYISKEQGAEGKDLYSQLKDLSKKGVFPGYFETISDLLRKVGNMGAHASDEELSVWDAELIDDFFRSIIDYVYIAPARIRRMERRLKAHET